MAQKALKSLAARNTAILNRAHLISLGVNGWFILLRLLFVRRSFWAYLLISLPAFAIEFWFERIGRPTYISTGSAQELKRGGEDLENKGLTEWMWDVVYFTWGLTVLVPILGNWLWWLYIAVPLYSAWLAYTTFTGARQGLAGMGGAGAGAGAGAEGAAPGGQSKRQAKMEKRGGQRVQYR